MHEEERKVATYVAKLNLTCWAANTGHLELLSLLMNLSPLIGLYRVNPWPCDMFLPLSTTVFIGSTGEYPQIYLNNNLTCCKSFVLVPWITFHSSIVKRWCFLTWNGKGEVWISLFVDKTIEKSSSQWSKLHGNSEYPSNAKRVNKETLISDDDERVWLILIIIIDIVSNYPGTLSVPNITMVITLN